MLLNFYRNTAVSIRQWFESVYFEPQLKMLKLRIDQSAASQSPVLQSRRTLNTRYRY